MSWIRLCLDWEIVRRRRCFVGREVEALVAKKVVRTVSGISLFPSATAENRSELNDVFSRAQKKTS